MTIPGIGESLAGLILSVREHHGNITPDMLISLTRGKISSEAIDSIDFSVNEDFGDEAQGYFDSRANTVKREPHMAELQSRLSQVRLANYRRWWPLLHKRSVCT